MSHRLRRALPGLLLLAAFAVVFRDYLRHPWALPFSRSSDLLRHYLPFKQSLHHLFQATGRLPGWDPFLLGGHPLAADPGYGAFYPLALPFYLLPPDRLFVPFFLFHVLLGALFLFRFLRAHHVSLEAACLGTAAWSLNLKLLTTLYAGFATMVPAQAWIPAAFLAAHRLKQAGAGRTRARATLGLAGAVAMQILAGDAQLALYTLVALVPFSLWVPLEAGASIRHAPPPSGEAPALDPRSPPEERGLEGHRSRLRRLLLLGAAAGLALLLAWPQWQPASRLTAESTRAGGIPYAIATLMSLPPAHLAALVVPALAGSDADLTYRGPSSFWEVSFYPGIVPWLLAAVALSRYRSDRRILPLALLAWLTLLVAFGRYTPLYTLLYYLAPGFDHFRGPARAMPLLALLLALLAGIGLDRISRPEEARARRALALAAAVLALCGGGVLLYLAGHRAEVIGSLEAHLRALIPAPRGGEESFRALLAGFGSAAGLLAAAAVALGRADAEGGGGELREPGGRLRNVLLALTALDLALAGGGLLRTAPLEEVLPPHPVAQILATEARGGTDEARGRTARPAGRVLDLAGALPDAVAVAAGLELMNGMNPLVMARPYLLARHLQGEPVELPTDRTVYGILVHRLERPRLLDLLRVTHVVTPGPAPIPGFVVGPPITGVRVFQQFRGMATYPTLYIHRRSRKLPAAWLVTAAEPAPAGAQEALARLEAIDPFQGALLEDPTGGTIVLPEALRGGLPTRGDERLEPEFPATSGRVEIDSWESDELRLTVEAPAAGGILVLSELYAAGWQVEIDGAPARALRADFLLRAVQVGTGRHRVRWWYRTFSHR